MEGYSVHELEKDDFPTTHSAKLVAQECYPRVNAMCPTSAELEKNKVVTEVGIWEVQKNIGSIFSLSYWRSLLNRVPDYNFVIKQRSQSKEQAFVLHETANLRSAEDAYESLKNMLEPLVDDCTLWLTGELLKELIAAKAYHDSSPGKLARIIVEIIDSNPNAHPNWSAVFRSLVLDAVSKDDVGALDSELLEKGGDELTASALRSAAMIGSGKSFRTIISTLSPEKKLKLLQEPDAGGKNAVEYAFENDTDESTVAEIVKSRVDISQVFTKRFLNPLHLAAMTDNSKSISASSRKKCGFLQTRSVDSLTNRQLRSALNALDGDGFTPLMVSCQCGYVESALSLLLAGADPNIQQPVSHDTALHFAARKRNAVLVKLLLVKGAQVNNKNKANQMPLDTAKEANAAECCDILTDVMELEEKAKQYLYAEDSEPFSPIPVPEGSEFLLAIDGGGSRSVLACLVLIALQKRMEQLSPTCKHVQYYFDVVAGTSGGGMNTLGLTHAKASPELLLELCMKVADEFLVGNPTYPARNVEKSLKESYGEDLLMTDVTVPRVVITTTIADVNPPILHLNCNYGDARNSQKPPSEWRVWEVCRATSAAPYYFTPFQNRFQDGGVMANNPTLSAMVEFFEQGEREHRKTKLGLVCSIGTGSSKPEAVEDIELAIPGFTNFTQTFKALVNITDTISGAVNLGKMIMSQAGLTDGIEALKAKMWCKSLDVPYFRLSPVLSKAYSLSEKNHTQLIHLMFEGHCFLIQQDTAKTIDTIARCLLTRGPVV